MCVDSNNLGLRAAQSINSWLHKLARGITMLILVFPLSGCHNFASDAGAKQRAADLLIALDYHDITPLSTSTKISGGFGGTGQTYRYVFTTTETLNEFKQRVLTYNLKSNKNFVGVVDINASSMRVFSDVLLDGKRVFDDEILDPKYAASIPRTWVFENSLPNGSNDPNLNYRILFIDMSTTSSLWRLEGKDIHTNIVALGLDN